jgi:glutamate dehydrogenase (NAD(P)+)
MGTDETCMAWVRDEIGRAVGLPRELGGIPLDEIGATGFGLGQVAEVAQEYAGLRLDGARLVIQGFGAVGSHAARHLVERGARLVGAADSRGTIYNPRGLDVAALIALKHSGRSVADYPDGTRLGREAVVGLDCDIWIPAARPDVINADNLDQVKARLVIEGANIPITEEAERVLHERGVLCVPDFIANAGGVICAAMEYRGATEGAALQTIAEKLRQNTALVLAAARDRGATPRKAALDLALTRVRKAMALRRFSLFSTAPGWL